MDNLWEYSAVFHRNSDRTEEFADIFPLHLYKFRDWICHYRRVKSKFTHSKIKEKIFSYTVKCWSCVVYQNRGLYLEPLWHFVSMLCQVFLVILFYFTAFQPSKSQIKEIPSWKLIDDDGNSSVKDRFRTILLFP